VNHAYLYKGLRAHGMNVLKYKLIKNKPKNRRPRERPRDSRRSRGRRRQPSNAGSFLPLSLVPLPRSLSPPHFQPKFHHFHNLVSLLSAGNQYAASSQWFVEMYSKCAVTALTSPACMASHSLEIVSATRHVRRSDTRVWVPRNVPAKHDIDMQCRF